MKVVKYIAIAAVGIVGLLVVGTIGLAIVGSQMSPEQLNSTNPKSAQQEPQKEVQKASTTQVADTSSTDAAIAGAETYYAAAAASDWTATYDMLSYDSQSYYSADYWTLANDHLGAGTYEVLSATEVSPKVFEVTVLVNGSDERVTYFIEDGGYYYHDLTAEEYAMFDDALSQLQGDPDSDPTVASASASASAAPADTSGQVAVEVVVEASEPVDVSIFDDAFATSINEQVTAETYSFTMSEGSGLSASASTADMMNGDVSIKVYEDGTLVSEDQATGMALVQY